MSTPTTRGKYRKLALGEGLQTWGLNNGLNGLFDQMDAALHGHNLITLSSTSYTLTSTNYTVSDINYRFVKFAGTPGGTATITIPATENWWLIQNSTGETLTFSNGANSASITGTSAFYGIVVTDGSAVSVLTLPDGVNVATVAPQVSNGNIASIAAQIANSNIPNLAASAVITSMNALSPQAVRDDMALLAVQDVIDDMALLSVQTIIDDMAALSAATVLQDMSLLSPSAVRTDMAALAVTSVINSMAAINTGTVIADLAAVAAGTVRTDMAAINSGTAISDMALISPTAVRTNMAAINTGTVISDMAAIVAGTVISDMATLSPRAADIGTLADIQDGTTATNAISIAATNSNNISDYSKTYLGSKSSAPTQRNDGSALQAGDLVFRSDLDQMQVRNAANNSWSAVAVTASNFLTVSNNLSDLNNAATARTNLGLDPLLAAKAPLASPAFTGSPTIGGTTIKTVATSGAYSDLSNAPTHLNVTGGSAGTIPYQTGANTTGMSAVGTAGQVLSSNGTSAPTWTNQSSGGGIATSLKFS